MTLVYIVEFSITERKAFTLTAITCGSLDTEGHAMLMITDVMSMKQENLSLKLKDSTLVSGGEHEKRSIY